MLMAALVAPVGTGHRQLASRNGKEDRKYLSRNCQTYTITT